MTILTMDTNHSLTQITPQATISQIIDADKQAAELLESIGLSLSKHENETLQSVCQQQRWSEVEVLDWIKKHTKEDSSKNSSDEKPSGKNPINEWAQHLEETFIDPNIELLKELTDTFPRIHKIHGNQYPWLKNVQWHFKKFKEALSMYYEFEKNKFLPLTKRLTNYKSGKIKHGTILNLENSFSIIKEDQDRLERLMATIRDKGNGFQNPGGACSSLRIQNKNFKMLFKNLKNQFKIEADQIIPLVKEEIEAKK